MRFGGNDARTFLVRDPLHPLQRGHQTAKAERRPRLRKDAGTKSRKSDARKRTMRGGDPLSTGTLRPMGFGDVLDAAFSLFRKSYVAIVLAMAIVNIPSAIIQLLTLQSALTRFTSIFGSTTSGSPPSTLPLAQLPGLFTQSLLVSIPVQLLTLLGTAAVFVVFDQVYRGGASNLGGAYRQALRRFLLALGIAILVGLAVGVGLIIVIIPGILAAVYFSQSLFLGVLTRDGVFTSIGRSVRLVRGFFWRVVGVTVVAYLVYAVANLLVTGIFEGILAGVAHAALGSVTYTAGVSIISLVLQTLLGTFPLAALYVQFMDLRVRKEGLDLHDVPPPAEA